MLPVAPDARSIRATLTSLRTCWTRHHCQGTGQLSLIVILLLGLGAGVPLGTSFNVIVLGPAALILVFGFSLIVGPSGSPWPLPVCLAAIVGGLHLGYMCGCLWLPRQGDIAG